MSDYAYQMVLLAVVVVAAAAYFIIHEFKDAARRKRETEDWLVEMDQRVQELEREREAKQP